MRLNEYLSKGFRNGIQYEDAIELCKAIYCAQNVLPQYVQSNDLSMNAIAEAFSDIAKLGLIKNYVPFNAVLCGANNHALEDKGHWVEVQASILKLGAAYDAQRVKDLLSTQS
jgi:hypothetical protein